MDKGAWIRVHDFTAKGAWLHQQKVRVEGFGCKVTPRGGRHRVEFVTLGDGKWRGVDARMRLVLPSAILSF